MLFANKKKSKFIFVFFSNRKGRPLWSSEDITPKMLSTQSATHLGYFLKYTVKCFKDLSPLALVEQRWSQVALQLALSCSSRHYAGRSFQILRALQIRPSTQMLSDILSRLVETVAEQGEDMQVLDQTSCQLHIVCSRSALITVSLHFCAVRHIFFSSAILDFILSF